MPLYDDFPYTNFHSLNLDWIVKKLSELENGESSEETTSTATLARNLSGNYPYTNFHSLNLDWIIRSMYELESDFETVENEWENLSTTGLLNDGIKNAILQCFENVAWVNDQGRQYYNTLHDLFFPPVIVDTLTAVLNQGEKVFYVGEDINVIKDYLTVTAELSDSTTITVPSTRYVLTGSLSQQGPNIITVTYMNASTTITVNAVAVSLVSISAVYTQSGTVYTTNTLDSLKSDLVVTATYNDSSTATVPSTDYTLSGTLAEGTSTITVTYEGLTATFNVTVTAWTLTWDYTDGGLPTDVASSDWTKSETGPSAHTISFDTDNGIKWVGRNGGYTLTPTNYQTTSVGTMETVVRFESPVNPNLNIRATLNTASNTLIGFLFKDGIKVNGSGSDHSFISGTEISLNRDYTLRVERNANSGKVYLDGVEVYSGELRALSGTNNVMISTTTDTSSVMGVVYIKAIRFKHIS